MHHSTHHKPRPLATSSLFVTLQPLFASFLTQYLTMSPLFSPTPVSSVSLMVGLNVYLLFSYLYLSKYYELLGKAWPLVYHWVPTSLANCKDYSLLLGMWRLFSSYLPYLPFGGRCRDGIWDTRILSAIHTCRRMGESGTGRTRTQNSDACLTKLQTQQGALEWVFPIGVVQHQTKMTGSFYLLLT